MGVAAKLPAAKKAAVTILARLLPRLGIKNELDPHDVSRDPAVVKRYIADPLVHDRVTTRWFVAFLKAIDTALAGAADIKLPILVQAAGKDRLVSTPAVTTFFERVSAQDQRLEIYPDLFHEVYNETEPDRQGVIDDLTAWLMFKDRDA